LLVALHNLFEFPVELSALCFSSLFVFSKAILIFVTGKIMQFNKELDARGLNCPLPILKAKKALAEMITGEVLRVIATDPGSVRDFKAFSKQTGNELLSHLEVSNEFEYFLKRK
jgi:tRNA 2-thiouridine synthesizing protein A